MSLLPGRKGQTNNTYTSSWLSSVDQIYKALSKLSSFHFRDGILNTEGALRYIHLSPLTEQLFSLVVEVFWYAVWPLKCLENGRKVVRITDSVSNIHCILFM